MAGTDNFASTSRAKDQPADNAAAVTPHDTNELPNYSRGLYIGGAGNLVIVTVGGDTVTFSNVPAGTVLPVRAKIVKSTSTTATSIVALY